MSDPTQSTLRAIGAPFLTAGLLVTFLDGLFVYVLYVHVLRLASPTRIAQSIAAALLGNDAFRGGAASAALGIVLHFAVAFAWTGVYAAIWASSSVLRAFTADLRGAALIGLLYGACVWLAMDLLIVPLTRARPTPLFSPIFAIMLAWHTIGVGLPIALRIRSVTFVTSHSLSHQGTGTMPPTTRHQGPDPTDEDLLACLRAGDTRALGAIAVRHWPLIGRVACLVTDPATAENLVGSAFLQLRDEHSVRPREPVRLALIRRVIDGAISRAPSSVLRAVISSLEEVDRLAFVLRRIERLPEPEVAEILELAPEEVRRRAGRLELQLAHRLWERRRAVRRGAA